jgi:quercetin dioxygenase-like cupin family protein
MIIKGSAIKPTILDEYSARKVLSNGGELMLVEITFSKGGVGALHSHSDHEQVSYIVKGSLEATVGAQTTVVTAGDSYYAGKNVPHGLKALEDSVVLDVFTPIRKDLL